MSCECEDIIIEVSEEGIDGNGIASIVLLSESGLTKTYRINFTNGSHFDYSLSDGNGIASIAKTSTAGLVDTYTIYMTDGVTTYTFTVTNGQNGEPGINTWGSIEGDINDQTDLKEALDLKADKADSYTKDELDGIFDGIDNALSTKADKTDVYTKTQADNLLAAKANTADLGALATMDAIDYTSDKLTNKPTLGTMAAEDASDYYDKDATDALLDGKADIIITSASGSLVHLTDAAPMPVKALSVAIEPVQDLHGYDNPWPAGGGVNLLPVGGTFDVTENDMRFQSDGNGKYTISGTSTATAYYNFSISEITLPSGDIYLHLLNSAVYSNFSFAFLRGNTQVAYASANASNRIVKLAELSGATVDTLRLFVNGVQTLNFTIQPMLMLTNTASSYVSYSNICPISGHSTTVVTRTGKNLFDASKTLNNTSSVFTNSGDLFTVGATTGNRIFYKMLFKAGVSYTLATTMITGTVKPCIIVRNSDGTTTGQASNYSNTNNPVVFTPTADVEWNVILQASKAGDALTVGNTFKIQIEEGSTATAYEAYQGTSVTISLGENRYGGTLDVLTGTLTVDRTIYTWNAGDTGTSVSNTKVYLKSKSDAATINSSNQTTFVGAICDKLPTGTWAQISGGSTSMAGLSWGNALAFRIAGYTTAEEYETFLTSNPLQFVYYLKEPVTVTLSPATLNLLKGENNLWSDTGDTEVTYRADTKLYIDSKLAAAVAELQALILEH